MFACSHCSHFCGEPFLVFLRKSSPSSYSNSWACCIRPSWGAKVHRKQGRWDSRTFSSCTVHLLACLLYTWEYTSTPACQSIHLSSTHLYTWVYTSTPAYWPWQWPQWPPLQWILSSPLPHRVSPVLPLFGTLSIQGAYVKSDSCFLILDFSQHLFIPAGGRTVYMGGYLQTLQCLILMSCFWGFSKTLFRWLLLWQKNETVSKTIWGTKCVHTSACTKYQAQWRHRCLPELTITEIEIF